MKDGSTLPTIHLGFTQYKEMEKIYEGLNDSNSKPVNKRKRHTPKIVSHPFERFLQKASDRR